MQITFLNRAQSLSDDELLAGIKTLAGRERVATAELVAHLAELDARKLYLPAGHSSMFTYYRDALGLSEHEAYNRIEVARAARRFPVVLDLLAERALNLTAVRLLAPHLTEANHAAVLESARGRRTSQVEDLVARLAPKPDAPTILRKLPEPPMPAALTAPEMPASSPASPPVPAPAPLHLPAIVEPLAPERYKLQLTISGDAVEMLQMAKDLLRHALPSGDDAAVLERALKALLTELLKQKFAATDNPRRSTGPADGSREVPAEVKRAVYLRDRGRCAFRGADGRCCHARGFIEFHHVRPYAHGGPPTVDNIELRCRAHNIYEWRRESTDLRIQEDEYYRRRLGDARRATRFTTSRRVTPSESP